MCGIVGFVGAGTDLDLGRMLNTLRYRGPDDQGIHFAKNVALGHARLSIIDLTPSGAQPMWNVEKTVGIIFNGEIYNFQELKKALVSEGRKFVSTSDTEVIIALYEKYGEACFEKLNDMFALAIYDAKQNKLLLARDRMGKKPLYYGTFAGTIIFASEPKAILAHPLVKAEIDSSALNAYLSLDYVPTPLSIFKGILKLPPATMLIFEDGKVRTKTFWTPDFHRSELSLADAIDQLDKQLSNATSSRLVADVPVGIFLSGGLDSSAIAYYAAKAKQEQIHTFSIGFDEASFDESRYAKEVAEHLGTIHHHKMLAGKDSLEIMPDIFSRLDEPLADASIIPTHLLSLFTKEHVTVALGGDGGDELFAGYPTFQAEKLVRMYRLLPERARRQLVEKAITMLPTSDGNLGLKFKAQKFLEGVGETDIVTRHMNWLGTFNENDRTKLLAGAMGKEVKSDDPYVYAKKYFAECDADDNLSKLLWVYQRTYMMDQVMVKVDRASMYASLETRAPFLDYQLVEFANSLPYEYKLRGYTTKYILKRLMKGKLPEHIINRTKKGFGIPVGAWLRGPLKDWGSTLFSHDNLNQSGVFDSDYVESLWNEHQTGKYDHRKKLWNLLVFLEWQRNFNKK